MLEIITHLKSFQGTKVGDIIRHRCSEYLEEKKLRLNDTNLKDGFDTDGTIYLAYKHKDYGIIG